MVIRDFGNTDRQKGTSHKLRRNDPTQAHPRTLSRAQEPDARLNAEVEALPTALIITRGKLEEALRHGPACAGIVPRSSACGRCASWLPRMRGGSSLRPAAPRQSGVPWQGGARTDRHLLGRLVAAGPTVIRRRTVTVRRLSARSYEVEITGSRGHRKGS